MDPISLPFGRGETYHGPSATISTDYDPHSVAIEGMRVFFKDKTVQSAGANEANRSGDYSECRVVRNTSGITLKARRAVIWESGYRDRRVDGYCHTTAQEIAGIVDPHLAYGNTNAGVRDDDLFWLVVNGPAEGLTSLAGNAENVISGGDRLVALTAATSQATTAGRLATFAGTFTVTQTTDGTATNYLTNYVGRAMTARTTANTDNSVLVNLRFGR